MKSKKQTKALKVYDMYRNAVTSPEVIEWATEHGNDAVIPLYGMTFDGLQDRLAKAKLSI